MTSPHGAPEVPPTQFTAASNSAFVILKVSMPEPSADTSIVHTVPTSVYKQQPSALYAAYVTGDSRLKALHFQNIRYSENPIVLTILPVLKGTSYVKVS